MAEQGLTGNARDLLSRFVVEGTATGKQLGMGAYGSVIEVCHSYCTGLLNTIADRLG